MTDYTVRFAYDLTIRDCESDYHAVQMATEQLGEKNPHDVKDALVVLSVDEGEQEEETTSG